MVTVDYSYHRHYNGQLHVRFLTLPGNSTTKAATKHCEKIRPCEREVHCVTSFVAVDTIKLTHLIVSCHCNKFFVNSPFKTPDSKMMNGPLSLLGLQQSTA